MKLLRLLNEHSIRNGTYGDDMSIQFHSTITGKSSQFTIQSAPPKLGLKISKTIMTIYNARYTKDGLIIANIDGVMMIIPNDMANYHRRMIDDWTKETGRQIEPCEESDSNETEVE